MIKKLAWLLIVISISLYSNIANAKTGETIKDCNECPELVVVPSGSFHMGGLNKGAYEQKRGHPIHKVTIGYSFAVGKYEVTFSQWDACVSDGGCKHNPNDKGWGRGNHPVMNVTWSDTKEFTRWLKQKTGKKYRLLSEAEWEYVARAGTSTIFPWGDNINPDQARYKSRSTVPVGSYKPNAFGLYDVVGNVWEWVEDCWHKNFVGAPKDGRAWKNTGAHNCNRRVVRGGLYLYPPNISRIAFRTSDSTVGNTAKRFNYYGFRVARDVSP